MRRYSYGVVTAWLFGAALAAVPSIAGAAYETPDPSYAAPTGYYSAANTTGTATDLRTSLHNIISTGFGTNGFVARTYGDARFALAITDQYPV
ncbi:MAG: hypothetical protein WCI73_07565, partial [Phycisphaerae bacterium]